MHERTTTHWITLGLLAAAAVALFSDARAARATAPTRHVVIVHPNNPVRQISKRMLSRVFLKKIARWPDGATIMPVDLPSTSSVRQEFSELELGRSVAAVKSYWQQIIFSGRGLPPPELDDDEQVLTYVRKHPGAIGYVSRRANLEGVVAIARDEDD